MQMSRDPMTQVMGIDILASFKDFSALDFIKLNMGISMADKHTASSWLHVSDRWMDVEWPLLISVNRTLALSASTRSTLSTSRGMRLLKSSD